VKNPKVFCIGLHQTGETSVGIALDHLGYRVTGPDGYDHPQIETHAHRLVDQRLPHFDAFKDVPWSVLYQYLDTKCPQSKFILTVRDQKTWIQNYISFFGIYQSPMLQWIYGLGAPQDNTSHYINYFNQHNMGVVQYFQNRPDDLLVINVSKDPHLWQRLCKFLAIDTVPHKQFPNQRHGLKHTFHQDVLHTQILVS